MARPPGVAPWRSGIGLSGPPVLSIVEPGRDERTEGGGGLISTRAHRFNFESCPAPGGQTDQVQDAAAIGRFAVARDSNLDRELPSQLNEPAGRPEVEAERR